LEVAAFFSKQGKQSLTTTLFHHRYSLVRKALPAWYVFLSLFAIIEIGTSGYLVGKGNNGGDYGGSLRSAVRFALFTGCEYSK